MAFPEKDCELKMIRSFKTGAKSAASTYRCYAFDDYQPAARTKVVTMLEFSYKMLESHEFTTVS
jgi:hypothetical protein